MQSGTLSPDRTMNPLYNMNDMPEGTPDVCGEFMFDAIFQHEVNGEMRTFAFSDRYYIEIGDMGMEMVSTDRDVMLSCNTSLIPGCTKHINSSVTQLVGLPSTNIR